jgi:hypothetical protein
LELLGAWRDYKHYGKVAASEPDISWSTFVVTTNATLLAFVGVIVVLLIFLLKELFCRDSGQDFATSKNVDSGPLLAKSTHILGMFQNPLRCVLAGFEFAKVHEIAPILFQWP